MTLVAHSMGGGEVVRHLTRHGSGRVRSVVLVATALGMPRLPPEAGDAVRNGVRVRLRRMGAPRVYENAPHGLMLSHRERFNDELLAFAKG